MPEAGECYHVEPGSKCLWAEHGVMAGRCGSVIPVFLYFVGLKLFYVEI